MSSLIRDEAELSSWDEETDVVVVGLGAAGAAATLEAARAGAETLVLIRDSPHEVDGSGEPFFGAAILGLHYRRVKWEIHLSMWATTDIIDEDELTAAPDPDATFGVITFGYRFGEPRAAAR